MGEVTGIGWTDHTWSPWWGCTKVSVGEFGACVNCYAEALDKRVGGDHWGVGKPRREMSEKHWATPLKWNKAVPAGDTRFVFPSMCDPFDNEVPPEWRRRFFDLIRATPNLTWLLLTKRPANIVKLGMAVPGGIPMNAALGCTVVTQDEADRDIPHLMRLQRRVRFVSIEPMLGPIDLTNIQTLIFPRAEKADALTGELSGMFGDPAGYAAPLSWVICGGESGPSPRPMQAEWARALRDQCSAAKVPFFFKQWGGRTPKANGKTLDDREWCERPVAVPS